MDKLYDVLIVGGGPSGLSASLALGRATKRVLLCDAGSRRNATATHIHNFVTRDGTPPEAFRRIGQEQLAAYPNVELRDEPVTGIAGDKGAFQVQVGPETVEARRILLCTGMIDEMLPIDGFAERWGHAIFQCPYCHGWEIRDRSWGYLLRAESGLHFPEVLLSWTAEVTVFKEATFQLPQEAATRLRAAGLRVETSPIARLVGEGRALQRAELVDGTQVPCQALYAHPPQRQVALVHELSLTLDAEGYVQADPMTRETSRPGIYAAGDLTTRMQAALAAAAMGLQAAAMINHELTSTRARSAT